MADEELIAIGRFARLSGLSIHTLRHYDDVGLLAPASVDAGTGYRRYRRDQIRMARLITALRWVGLPIQHIRAMVGPGADPAAVEELLRAHRELLERKQRHLADQLRDTNREA